MKDVNSLAHSKWRCQYHIVFAPKYRRKEIYGKLRADIGQILRKLCEQKGVDIKAQEQNENVAWNKKGDERFMICAVGGKDNFDRFFSRDIQRAILNASNGDPFPRIALITDRDDRDVAEIEQDIAQKLSPFFTGTTRKATSTLSSPATSIRPIGEPTSMRMTPCFVRWTGSLTMPRYLILRAKVSGVRSWRPLPTDQ